MTTLDFYEIANPDYMATHIANKWVEWNSMRATWLAQKQELVKYIYATDTTTTTNNQLPWKNKTTIPKLCQTRDNLYANYMASMFPKDKWLFWHANERDANSKLKREAILNYMYWAVSQEEYRREMGKCVLDYIDYGNAFATIEWVDQRSTLSAPPVQVGYVGPMVRRISPNDIVFNPTASSFLETPKIIRSLVSMGELKRILESQSTDDDKQAYQDLYDYLVEMRATVRATAADLKNVDSFYQVDGFSSFQAYLNSETVEILTFYGDMFDWNTKELYPNHKIMVVDRHKLISKKPNPSYFGFPPIFHVGWRPRQDNLWAMGPLDNLVGMQYRIDHIENLKADVFDLIAFPPLKIKGYVEDFNWGPMERIFIGDEGDVSMMAPPFQVLQYNVELQNYFNTMEEIAGAPKEAMGFRSPGEKTAYEVQRLENAASRIFQTRIVQFEVGFEEWVLNGMLELARRNLSGVVSFPIFDDDFNIQVFTSLTPADITGAGRLKPMAARHFAEQAELVQNLTNFYSSAIGQDQSIRVHFSGIGLAKLFESLLGVEEYGIVMKDVRVAEMADTARLQQAAQRQVMTEGMTPSGIGTDGDHPFAQGGQPQPQVQSQPPFDLKRQPPAGATPGGLLATQ